MSAAQIHQITQELAKAASEAAPKGSVIKTRRAQAGSAGVSGDEVYVGVRAGGESAAQVQQKLEGVATAHRLTVNTESGSGNTVRLVLRSHGVVTQRIEIEERPNSESASGGKTGASGAKLAILLDDLGSDRGAADEIFALHVPVTVSVLPYHAHSQEIAEAAHGHGCEVMLHLPMQSVGKQSAEAQELKPGLSEEQVRTVVEKMLDAVPHADGVNNHQGSQATADTTLMSELMQVLREDGVFYVDSRTSAETVAYDTARRESVKTAYRNVPFLDDVDEKSAVEKQLELAMRLAKEKGEGIAIGHPRPATLGALREVLPNAKREGVQLVYVSELVR